MTATDRLQAIAARVAIRRQAEYRRREQIEQSRQACIAAAEQLRSRMGVLNGVPYDDGFLRIEPHGGTQDVAVIIINRTGHVGGGAYCLLTITPQLEPGRPAEELDYRVFRPGDVDRPVMDERFATEDAALDRALDILEPLIHLPTLEG